MHHDEEQGSVSRHRRRDGSIGYRVRLWVDGRRVSYGVYDDEATARDRLAAALEQRGDRDGTITLRAWGIDWLSAREKRGSRAIRTERLCWGKHVAPSWIAAMPLRRITRAHVVRFVRELEAKRHARTGALLSRQTLVHALNLLRRSLGDAADEGKIAANPASDVRITKNRASSAQPWTFLTLAEIARLEALPVCAGTESAPLARNRNGTESDTLTPAQRTIFIVGIYTGLRDGEMWALRWGDVVLDEERPEILVRASNDGATKSGRVRRVPLLEPARLELERWKQLRPGIAGALVFPSADGSQHACGYDADWPRVKRELLKIERRVRLYDLRHTCASHLVQGSWGRVYSLAEIAAWLGHSNISITMRYSHLAPGGLHDAARATNPRLASHRKEDQRSEDAPRSLDEARAKRRVPPMGVDGA